MQCYTLKDRHVHNTHTSTHKYRKYTLVEAALAIGVILKDSGVVLWVIPTHLVLWEQKILSVCVSASVCVPFLEDINRANQRGPSNSLSSVCCVYIKHAIATFLVDSLYANEKWMWT